MFIFLTFRLSVFGVAEWRFTPYPHFERFLASSYVLAGSNVALRMLAIGVTENERREEGSNRKQGYIALSTNCILGSIQLFTPNLAINRTFGHDWPRLLTTYT